MHEVGGHTDHYAFDAVETEDVAVGAAAGGLDVGFHAHVAHDAGYELGGGLVGVEAVHLEHHFQAFGDFGLGITTADVADGVEELHSEQFQGLHVHAAEFAGDGRLGRDRVADGAAGDGGDVEGGFLIDTALGEVGDDVAGDLDGGEAFFGFDAGVGSPTANVYVEGHVGGAAAGDGVDGAVAVKDDRLGGVDHGEVKIGRADQADFFAAGEHYLDRTAGASLFTDGFESLQDGGHAGLAIAAKNGVAVGGDSVAGDLGPDAAAGVNGIHVGGEQEGLVAVLAGDDVAVVVAGNLETEVGQAVGHLEGDIPFLAGGAVDTYQVAEIVDQSFLVGHGDTSVVGQ